jgi:hypothetical protein
LALVNKVLAMANSMYLTYKGLKLDDNHILYFVEDELRCSKVYRTDESDFLYIEDSESRTILANEVKVIDEEEQLEDIKDVILNKDISLYDYITKMYKYDDLGSLGLIEKGGYKPKKIKE